MSGQPQITRALANPLRFRHSQQFGRSEDHSMEKVA